MEEQGDAGPKVCVRCEEPIPQDGPRYFAARVIDGVRRIEYFDPACFKAWCPDAAAMLDQAERRIS